MPDDLTALIDRELRRLPMPRAPQTLLPRVMAAVEKWARRPWYERAWFTWPIGWKVASVGVLILLVAAGAAFVVPAAVSGISSALSWGFAETIRMALDAGVEGAGTAAIAVRILWRVLLQPFVPYAFILVALMCLAIAAFGAVLNRVIVGRTVQL